MMQILPFTEPKGHYEPLPEQEGEANRSSIVRRNRFFSHFLSFLAGCLVIGLGGLLSRISVNTKATQLSPIPSMPIETVVFTSHPEFSTASSKAWKSLTKDFSGYIHIDNPKEYNLPPGLLNEQGKEVYGVSMYHSLHCLEAIHEDYWRLSLSSPFSESPYQDDEYEAMRAHIGHCFDYLRQSIQCSADMTISWANLTEPERPHIDGWNIPHRQCRDWKSILPDLISMDALVNEHHHHAGMA